MGEWADKRGRKRNPLMWLGRDRRWAVPFMIDACKKHNRPIADLVRKALCKRLTGRADDTPEVYAARSYGKEKWDSVQIRLTSKWMSDALVAESERRGVSASDVLFIVFCEEHGAEFPELQAMYEKWRQVTMSEAS